MNEQEALELGNKLYANITSNANNIIKTNDYIKFVGMAIKALEEIQQYRAIENELKERYRANVGIKEVMNYFIETIFKGEKHDRFCFLTNEDAEQWEAYKAIGTVEECRAAVEKQKIMKPHKNFEKFSGVWCSCGKYLGKGYFVDKPNYCSDCGQKLDWEGGGVNE